MKHTVIHWREKLPFTETGRTFGAIDHLLPPISDDSVRLIVRGWFFDLNAEVSRPTCRIGDHSPLLFTYSCYRADVLKAFPSFPASKYSGFLASFPQAIKNTNDGLTISYCGRDENTEITFTLPLPECPWLEQTEKFSVIAVITSASMLSSLFDWSERNKPELILCVESLLNQFDRLRDECSVKAYPDNTLGFFLHTFLRPDTQVVLFSEPGDQIGRNIQNTLVIGPAQPLLRFATEEASQHLPERKNLLPF